MDELLYELQRNGFGGMMLFYGIIGKIVLLLLVIRIIRKIIKPDIYGNWNGLLDDFKYDTGQFYDQLSQKVKESQIEGVKTKIVWHREGHLFSKRRKYIRFTWKRYSYDCCFAPFGKGSFVSWWYFYRRGIRETILSIMPLGERWVRAWFPMTFFKYDTASMFRTYMQEAVLEVIDEITKDTGIRLTEEQRKPNLKEIIKR